MKEIVTSLLEKAVAVFPPSNLAAFVMVLLILWGPRAVAEQGYLVVHVRDVKDRPLVGVEIGTEGDGGTGKSDPKGKARIRLAAQTRPGQRVTLQIVPVPGKRDLVFISPWDRIAQVPPFDNESN